MRTLRLGILNQNNKLRLALVLGALALPALAHAAPIDKVEVVGNHRIEADAIRERMKIKPGSDPSADTVASDIQSIFKLGYFEDVRVEREGATLFVTVRERPVVTEIKYEGSDEFETKDLEEATQLRPFNVLNLTKIRLAQVAIAKKYEEKGYYLARAEYKLVPNPERPGEISLTFNITENEKVRIRKIFFLGNKVFSSADLKKIMATSEGHVFSWATNGGTYREGAFDRDLSILAFFYGNEGYIEAKFAKPRVTLGQDRRYIDIFIDVEEGKKYYLGDVRFKGDLLFTADNLRDSFGMAEKDVFSTGKLQEEVLKLTDKYGDEGYAFANVIPRTQIREGTDIVDLNFEIEPGEKVYWGRIEVTGNTKTHDKVVRRELPFHEGELYNATKRKKGLEKIRRLGFFGNDVNFLTSTPAGKTDVLNLEIRVAEKPTGSLNVSAGWGSATRFVFTAQVMQNNFRGLGQQLSFQLSYNQLDAKTFQLGFTDPHIFDTEWLGAVDLYIKENPYLQAYKQRSVGGALRTGREIAENLSLYATYRLDRTKLSNIINPAVLTDPDKDANSLISSLAGTISYDTRNNRLDPSGGEFFWVNSEFGGLGGRVFQKYTSWFRVYRRLAWKFVYRANLEFGLLANAMGDDTPPDSERFVLGGYSSLRGYDIATVGEVRRVEDLRSGAAKNADGSPRLLPIVIGGTRQMFTQHELEFPLIPDADIRAVFFFDAGNAWRRGDVLSPVLLSNWGWGIRWYSPLGPLRFEWGYPFTKIPTSTNDPVFNFIIAPTF